MWSKIQKEPALAMTLVQATIGLITAFGLQLTAEQVASILCVTGAMLGFITRSMVTPTVKVGAQ